MDTKYGITDEGAEAAAQPPVSQTEPSDLLSGVVGEVLFDGHAVLQELRDREKHFVSPEAVSGVLDAVVRLIKKGR